MSSKVLKAHDHRCTMTNGSLISQHCSWGLVYGKKKIKKKEVQIFIQLWQKFKKVPVQPVLKEERVFQSITAFIYLCGHVCPVSSGGRASPSHAAVWDRPDRQMKGSDLALLIQQYDTLVNMCLWCWCRNPNYELRGQNDRAWCGGPSWSAVRCFFRWHEISL